MKKILLSAAAIVVATALIGPKIVSSQFTQGIEDSVAAINKNPAYTASITSIESAWFSTQAVVNVGINIPQMSPEGQEAFDMSVNVIVNGEHGPILTQDGFHLAWLHTQIETQNNALPANFSVTNNAPIYQLSAYTGLFGSTDYSDQVAAIDYVDEASQTTFNFSGMQGQGTLSSDGFKGASKAESLAINVADVLLFDMNTLAIEVDADVGLLDMLEQSLYASNSLISIGSMNIVNNAEGSQTTIQALVMKVISSLDQNSGLGDVEIATTVASVEESDLRLSDVLATLQLNNLEAAFFKAYQKFSSEIMEYGNDLDKISSATNTFFENNLLSQLQAEPEYNLSALSGNINGSAFNGKALAKLVGISSLPATMEDPAFWIQHTQVDSHLSMQKGAAEFIAKQIITSQIGENPNFAEMSAEERDAIIMQQVAPTLMALEQQGMIIATEDGYELNFTLQDGLANLNGTPIPL